MNEQKQIGQLHAVVIQNLPEMTSEQRQRWIGDPKGLQNFLSGLVEVVATVVKSLVSTCKQVVNYDRSIADALKAGKYDWKNDDITDRNFPSTESGEREIEFGLFHFGCTTSSEVNIAEMKEAGFRPATMKELLSYGEKNSKVQLEYPIIALGSVVGLYGRRFVGYLYGSGSERGANLFYFDGDWSDDCRFLAVRN